MCSLVIFFKIWVWGLFFIIWGLIEWLQAFSAKYMSVFIAHWLTIALIVIATGVLVNRRRQQSEEQKPPSLFQIK
ncbi:MAG: hypothetical protein IH584_07490 [Candidatus Aminicenantes bacterium]|nr:hypothetical protein [Candidatus Aminicenantes bacterium]